MALIQHKYILVGIETDPTRYHGENASRPALLDRLAAEQMLAHIATDLTGMFPAINRCSLSIAGALFDQTQVLRPQLPVFSALETLQQSSNPGGDFRHYNPSKKYRLACYRFYRCLSVAPQNLLMNWQRKWSIVFLSRVNSRPTLPRVWSHIFRFPSTTRAS